MIIRKVNPITEEFIVRKCISPANQDKYLKKMTKDDIILYAGYEGKNFLGVTGIEFDRKVHYFDLEGNEQTYNCDYICAGFVLDFQIISDLNKFFIL